MPLGEEWLERSSLWLPGLIRQVEHVVAEQPRLAVHRSQLVHGVVAGAREYVVGTLRRSDHDERGNDVSWADLHPDDRPGEVTDDSGARVELPQRTEPPREGHRCDRRQAG